MKKTLQSIAVLGEILLGFGLLWMFLTGTFRADMLPESLRDFNAAVLMTGLGITLWQGGKMLARQFNPLPQPEAVGAGDRSNSDLDQVLHGETSAIWNHASSQPLTDRRDDQTQAPIDRAQERICLRAVWPQRPTGSWLGGLPHLPPAMDWPAIDGQPATFLAQIALEELPETLWQGLGPRRGWLAFFSDPEQSANIAIRHVSGPVTERPQPWNVRQDWHFNTEPAGLRGGNPSTVPVQPRWYLEICEDAPLGAVEDMEAENPEYWDDEKGNYIWDDTWTMQRSTFMARITADKDLRFGFDWPSFLSLFDLWQSRLHERKQHYAAMLSKHDQTLAATEQTNLADLRRLEDAADREGTAEAQEALETKKLLIAAARKRQDEIKTRNRITLQELENVCAMLPEIEQDMRAASLDTPWHAQIGAEFFQLTEDFNARLKEAGGAPLVPLERHWPAVIETYARQLYTTAPEALPSKLLDILEPLWKLQAEETVIFMGLNHAGGDGAPPDARLIDLPTNPLSGVHFGDMSRLYVDIPAKALEQSDFSQARAQDTHGIY